jgi:hypothetical protein
LFEYSFVFGSTVQLVHPNERSDEAD